MLAELWNGSSWSSEPPPDPSGGTPSEKSGLTSVSCTSATACTAMGYYLAPLSPVGLQTETLAEYWNGSGWSYTKADSSLAMPEFAGGGTLAAVSCTSSPYCTATGQGNGEAIAERSYLGGSSMYSITWEGGPTPISAGTTSSSLSGVSCISTTLCIAVGNYVDSSGHEQTLAEGWSA
jgi:hypothetical protein